MSDIIVAKQRRSRAIKQGAHANPAQAKKVFAFLI